MSDRQPKMTFTFDSTICSGCKCCQIACKDRNDLEVGSLWRKVYEVAGGQWERKGNAWQGDVFAFNLSMSCNHCERPICLEVCPAGAISRRPDGIVQLDNAKCLGCGYCRWACPYSSPQYNNDAGCMGKCSFCSEDLDEGLDPACVSACPVRALGWRDSVEVMEGSGGRALSTSCNPLPPADLTNPSIDIREHRQAYRAREELAQIDPKPKRGLREWSLVWFTVITQMAAGMVLCLGGLRWWFFKQGNELLAETIDRIGFRTVLPMLALAMLISLLHLGRKQNLWRVLSNLRSSWLSREIFVTITLLILVGTAIWSDIGSGPCYFKRIAPWATVPAALMLVAGMARLYMLRTVPTWNTILTPLAFLSTSLLLGGLILNVLLWSIHAGASSAFTVQTRAALGAGLSVALIFLQFGIWVFLRLWLARQIRTVESGENGPVSFLAPTLINVTLSFFCGIALVLILVFVTRGVLTGVPLQILSIGALGFALSAEVAGRSSFFGSYRRVGV